MNNLAQLRKQKKLSQVELGKILGVAQNTLCNWENGKREINNDSLLKLADFFDVSIDYILGRNVDNLSEDLIILNRNAKKLSPENRKKLLDVAKAMFGEEFDE
ncbi:MAG: helix-turn-helix transcriptional regulator [Ruminiclostridium sp.]|nr:helix-turn-helix transcriptional regulator [Ruminiclostridium sp.]